MRFLLIDADIALLAMIPVHFLCDFYMVSRQAFFTDLAFLLGTGSGNSGVQKRSGEPCEIDKDDIEGQYEEERGSFL